MASSKNRLFLKKTPVNINFFMEKESLTVGFEAAHFLKNMERCLAVIGLF